MGLKENNQGLEPLRAGPRWQLVHPGDAPSLQKPEVV